MTESSHEAEERGPAGGAFLSIAHAAWILTRELIASWTFGAVLVAGLLLQLVSQSLLPLGIAASETGAADLSAELRTLLFLGLGLLVLLRVVAWRPMLAGTGDVSRGVIVSLSTSYLHCIVGMCLAVEAYAFNPRSLRWDPGAIGDSLWLSSLVGILSLARLEPRALGLLYLLLAWWVPVLGTTGHIGVLHAAKAFSLPPWSADGLLPMLVPQFLALSLVTLGRVVR